MSYDDLVLTTSPEPSIKWVPEDYKFKSPMGKTSLWYYKNLELRPFSHDYWLCRKKSKNKQGNTEMKVKWYVKIPLSDREFADAMFTKGLL